MTTPNVPGFNHSSFRLEEVKEEVKEEVTKAGPRSGSVQAGNSPKLPYETPTLTSLSVTSTASSGGLGVDGGAALEVGLS